MFDFIFLIRCLSLNEISKLTSALFLTVKNVVTKRMTEHMQKFTDVMYGQAGQPQMTLLVIAKKHFLNFIYLDFLFQLFV